MYYMGRAWASNRSTKQPLGNQVATQLAKAMRASGGIRSRRSRASSGSSSTEEPGCGSGGLSPIGAPIPRYTGSVNGWAPLAGASGNSRPRARIEAMLTQIYFDILLRQRLVSGADGMPAKVKSLFDHR